MLNGEILTLIGNWVGIPPVNQNWNSCCRGFRYPTACHLPKMYSFRVLWGHSGVNLFICHQVKRKTWLARPIRRKCFGPGMRSCIPARWQNSWNCAAICCPQVIFLSQLHCREDLNINIQHRSSSRCVCFCILEFPKNHIIESTSFYNHQLYSFCITF